MSAIKVKFVKEIDVDLNAYYENFPRPLRNEIDDAIFKLLGGQEVTKKAAGHRRTKRADDAPMKIGKKAKLGSKTHAVMVELQRRFNGTTFTLGELKVAMKSMENEFKMKEPSKWIHNMIMHKHVDYIR